MQPPAHAEEVLVAILVASGDAMSRVSTREMLFADAVMRSECLASVRLDRDRPFVYVMQIGPDGPFKIGTAKNAECVKARLRATQTASPELVFLRRLFQGGRELERALHARFRGANIRGEWFRPTAGLRKLVSAYELDHLPEAA